MVIDWRISAVCYYSRAALTVVTLGIVQDNSNSGPCGWMIGFFLILGCLNSDDTGFGLNLMGARVF